MSNGSAAYGFGMLAFGVIGIPIVICALLGAQKGRRWYWFAPLGLLSFLGVLIAVSIRSLRAEESITGLFVGVPPWRLAVLRTAAQVKVTEAPVAGVQSLGLVAVDLFEPLPGRSSSPPDFALAIDALRVRAAELGANAVCEAKCVRTDQLPWGGEPQTVYHVAGAASLVPPTSYPSVHGEISTIIPDSYVGELPPAFRRDAERVPADIASWAVASGIPSSTRIRGIRSVYGHLMRLQADARVVGRLRHAAGVPVILGEPSVQCEPACEIAVSEYVDLSSSSGVDAGLVLDHLRLKAIGAGANAVVRVQCLRTKPKFWEDKSCGQIEVRGLAVRVDPEELGGIRSETDSIQLMIYPTEPIRAVAGSMLFDGFASAGMAALCTVCVYSTLQPVSGGGPAVAGRWFVPPAVCYSLLAAELGAGVGLAIRRTPGMLTLAARLAMVTGAVLIICPEQAIFGACQVIWGLSRTLRYRQIWRGVRAYQGLKAASEAESARPEPPDRDTNI